MRSRIKSKSRTVRIWIPILSLALHLNPSLLHDLTPYLARKVASVGPRKLDSSAMSFADQVTWWTLTGGAMAGSSSASVTHWIELLKAGDPVAAQKLWEGYFQRLVGLARKKLQGIRRRAADEEDVALSAFDSFCRGAEQGRYPQISDRDDLWQHLVLITARKAIDLVHHERRQKRGGGAVRGESALLTPENSSVNAGMEQVADAQPTPAFAAEVAEECQRLLVQLGDGELRAVALWKMEGYTNEEIAAKLGCVPRTVERKLWRIRSIWAKEIMP
jgi:DNA-directed RNA polymerase specialized sigma24 family protein